MKTCYLCGKQKPDCLLNPPACFECRVREGGKPTGPGVAVGTPEGWKQTRTWQDIASPYQRLLPYKPTHEDCDCSQCLPP